MFYFLIIIHHKSTDINAWQNVSRLWEEGGYPPPRPVDWKQDPFPWCISFCGVIYLFMYISEDILIYLLMYLFIFRQRGRAERERNVDVWFSLMCLQPRHVP